MEKFQLVSSEFRSSKAVPVSNKGCKCEAVHEPCHFCICQCEVFGKTFVASRIFSNELQGYNHKLLMASMVDITLFVSSFSIYVIY